MTDYHNNFVITCADLKSQNFAGGYTIPECPARIILDRANGINPNLGFTIENLHIATQTEINLAISIFLI